MVKIEAVFGPMRRVVPHRRELLAAEEEKWQRGGQMNSGPDGGDARGHGRGGARGRGDACARLQLATLRPAAVLSLTYQCV